MTENSDHLGEFVGEPIIPDPAHFDSRFMSTGSPGLPRQFIWRDETIKVRDVLKVWRTTGPCHHGSHEQYVRRHWFEVITHAHGAMKIYFDKGLRGKRKEMGWFIFTVERKRQS